MNIPAKILFWAGALLASSPIHAIEISDPAVLAKAKQLAVPGFDAATVLDAMETQGQWKDVIEFKWKKNASLPSGTLSKIEVKIPDDGKKIFTLNLSPDVMDNPALLSEVLSELGSIMPGGSLKFPGYGWTSSWSHGSGRMFRWMEWMDNAKRGSTGGKYGLKIYELESITSGMDFVLSSLGYAESPGAYKTFVEGAALGTATAASAGTDPVIDSMKQVDRAKLLDYLESRYKSAHGEFKSVAKEYKKIRAAQKKLYEKKRPKFNQLEAASKKLDHYIAANDRVNVKKLLEAYIPWEIMEPTESVTWRTWVDAIVNPSEERVTLFRGLSNDLVRVADDGVGHFTFSTMLARNQGNYTRRLRSIVTMIERLNSIGSSANLQNYNRLGFNLPFTVDTPPGSIANLMHAHMLDPVGSPFLSMSSSLRVATNFSHNWSSSTGGSTAHVSAMSIPRNRTLRNALSGYNSEVEYLAPLIIFPDEMVHVEELPYNDTVQQTFVNHLHEATGITVPAEQLSHGESWDRFFTGGFTDFRGLMPSYCQQFFLPEDVL